MHSLVYPYALLQFSEELPSIDELISSIQSYRKSKNLQFARDIHAYACHSGLEDHERLGNHLVPAFVECGSLKNAQQIFDKLNFRNECSWSGLIEAYVDCGEAEHAFCLYQHMQDEGIYPSRYTFIGLLKACTSLFCLKRGCDVHIDLARCGFEQDVYVGSSLVDMYAKCGSLPKAQEVFDSLPHRNVSAWTALISGYVQEGLSEQALEAFKQMQCEGYADSGQAEQAMDCFDQMCTDGISPDRTSWNSVLSGFADEGNIEKAIQVYAQMQEQGCLPDRVIFLTMSVTCGNAPVLERGKRIHAQIHGVCGVESSDTILMNCLIDMYGKCGEMFDAQKVFNAMPTRNHLTWSTLISGYACEGKIKHVLRLFEEARQMGVQLDGISSLGIISACTHTGLIEKGQEHFKLMPNSYRINPTIEHFACMVDLHSRAGQLNEAMALIKKMPFQPSLVVWLTILGACKIWGNVGLGRIAFDRAMHLEERDPSLFKLMCQIYMGAQMWEDAKLIEVGYGRLNSEISVQTFKEK